MLIPRNLLKQQISRIGQLERGPLLRIPKIYNSWVWGALHSEFQMESDPFIYRGVLSSVYFLFVLVLAPASLLEPAADLSASKAKLLPNLPKKDLVQVKTLQILRDLSPPPL